MGPARAIPGRIRSPRPALTVRPAYDRNGQYSTPEHPDKGGRSHQSIAASQRVH